MIDGTRELAVLYLEDSEQDAELVSAALEEGGLRCKIERVDTEEAFVAALRSRQFDVILSDFSMPGFDGKSGLRIARETCPETPFVFVSGTIGEHAAVETLADGATDFVLKDHPFSRLVPVITGAIRESKERQLRADAEATLRRSEEKCRRLFEHLAVPLLITSPDGQFLDANPACIRLLGYANKEEMLHLDIHEAVFLEPGQPAELRRAVHGEGEIQDIEVKLRRKDGSTLIALTTMTPEKSTSGEIIAYWTVWRDITDQRRLESQFRQAQKMEAVGRLAGGIAHDFNNVLTIISGYSTMVLAEELNPGQQRKIKAIRDASTRAANLIRQLLAFSRKQLLQKQVLSLNALVTQVETLMGRIIGEDIAFVTQLDPTLKAVKADPGQLEQVLMNLVVNARDAMPNGGTLTIATRNMRLDHSFFRYQFSVEPGDYAMVSVEDTGCGMDEETQAKIFEPFFTTKENGKGTGLGLSTVYGIVKQSGGYIWVRSEPNAGSTFSVFLPVAETNVPAIPGETKAAAEVKSGDETILLVEDDEHVREFTAVVLRRHGYTVIEAKDGQGALEIAKQHPSPIHLLLTDVVLPRLSGPGLAREVVGFRPTLKVVYISGYSEHGKAGDGVAPGTVDLLQKPFTPPLLLEKVREVLDRKANETVRKGASVLVVEDDVELLTLLDTALTQAKFSVFRAANAIDARHILTQVHCDLVITDVMMPYKDGVDFAMELKREMPAMKILVISVVPSALKYVDGTDLLRDVVTIAKPFTVDLLIAKIRLLLGDRLPEQSSDRS
jgi:two-component system cell cycle sensor histidine kinase/response regulator CckA